MILKESNIVHYGDVLAVPFFALAVKYFYDKENKTNIEKLLLLFVTIGFIFDLYFSYKFLTK
jgi:hypothetical protein